ncbi:TetR/AcrR family transcriptional regulator [Enterococcus raffinosus]|uniref:TetR/AcrR family transcriptional regulator n=1 Tax=Enterococcus raffinosus TaxID=71452 RepID=UPI001C0F7B74|nr:TetR/AcrR family transcriptional regulator [Enterococcus raffinosus]MBU5363684.1 TetR/AcrR family transcriptional regulator [Enterococcus raffinosus]
MNNTQSYHRENLRNDLIAAGIKIVRTEGLERLSLRKVAKECQVSHAAPYTYFSNKQELLNAMQLHITKKFTHIMNEASERYSNDPDLLTKLGNIYLQFFLDNPQYFNFTFNLVGIEVNMDNIDQDNYPPFDILKKAVVQKLQAQHFSDESIMYNLTAIWAVIHGATSIATMKSVLFSEDWGEWITKILQNNFSFYSGSVD